MNPNIKKTGSLAASRSKGIMFILMAAFFFSLMTVFVRLSGDVPTMQKAFFRNIVAAFLAAFILMRSGEKFYIPRTSLMDMFLRCSIGTMGILWTKQGRVAQRPACFHRSSFCSQAWRGHRILPGSGRHPRRLYSGNCLHLCAQTRSQWREGTGDRLLLLRVLDDHTAAQHSAQLPSDVYKAVCLPGPGRMFRGDRAALCHCRLPERASQGHLCFRLLTSSLRGNVRIPAMERDPGCLELSGICDHHRNSVWKVVLDDEIYSSAEPVPHKKRRYVIV